MKAIVTIILPSIHNWNHSLRSMKRRRTFFQFLWENCLREYVWFIIIGTCRTRVQMKHCKTTYSITRIQMEIGKYHQQLKNLHPDEIKECLHQKFKEIREDVEKCSLSCPTPCEEETFSMSVSMIGSSWYVLPYRAGPAYHSRQYLPFYHSTILPFNSTSVSKISFK